MGLSTKKIAEIKITISPKAEILEEIRKYLKKLTTHNSQPITQKVKPFVIFTPNPEIITYAQSDKDFVRIVNSAQINLPDGAGVVWAVKKLYGDKIEQIAGIDFMLELCSLANKQGFTVGLIGGRGGVALKTKECLLKSFPKLEIEVLEAPEVEIQNSKLKMQNYNLKLKIIDKIIKEKIDILFVALGFPKQEYFIDNLKKYLLKLGRYNGSKDNDHTNPSYSINLYGRRIVIMAVGGAFDYISGRIPRAPILIRNLGLEWLFRLILEPWRLPRQLKGAEFFWRVLKATA